MPTLEWIGKSKVINHHQDVPFRVLERKYSFDENGQHNEDNGSENMIIRGDNLEALKALLPRYEGRVKCIYIDPPYNTGHDFIYRDDFGMSREEWSEKSGELSEDGDRLFENTESNGRFHSDWCSMTYSRLMLARNLLTEDGVVLIYIDDCEI